MLEIIVVAAVCRRGLFAFRWRPANRHLAEVTENLNTSTSTAA